MNKKTIFLFIISGIIYQNSFARTKHWQYSTPWFGLKFDMAEKTSGDLFPNWGDLMLKMEDTFQSHDIKIYETKNGKRWGIEIGLPGFKENEIKIKIKDEGVLTITAETSSEKEKSKKDEKKDRVYIYKSKSAQKKYFSKTFKLPESVDWQNTKATKVSYEEATLKIEFEKKEEVKPKEVTLSISKKDKLKKLELDK